jgi:hypothetical protein
VKFYAAGAVRFMNVHTIPAPIALTVNIGHSKANQKSRRNHPQRVTLGFALIATTRIHLSRLFVKVVVNISKALSIHLSTYISPTYFPGNQSLPGFLYIPLTDGTYIEAFLQIPIKHA